MSTKWLGRAVELAIVLEILMLVGREFGKWPLGHWSYFWLLLCLLATVYMRGRTDEINR